MTAASARAVGWQRFSGFMTMQPKQKRTMASAFGWMPRPALHYPKPPRTDGTRNGGAVSSISMPGPTALAARLLPQRKLRAGCGLARGRQAPGFQADLGHFSVLR